MNSLGYLKALMVHGNRKKRKLSRGKLDFDNTYDIIRPMNRKQGLLSLFKNTNDMCKQSIQDGHIPYVDFQNYKCQYNVNYKVNNTFNAWEYYFTQPTLALEHDITTMDALYQKKNLILSGWEYKNGKINYKNGVEDEKLNFKIDTGIRVNDYVMGLAEQKYEELFEGKKTLGIFVRGTDYVALRPYGHPIQPDTKMLAEKIDEYLLRYPNIEKIFVVTEDYAIYTELEKKYGTKVFCSDDKFVKDYDGKAWIYKYFDDNPYERGLNYLVRIILLSKCNYLIAGMANGIEFIENELTSNYEDKFIFDLGLYD